VWTGPQAECVSVSVYIYASEKTWQDTTNEDLEKWDWTGKTQSPLPEIVYQVTDSRRAVFQKEQEELSK